MTLAQNPKSDNFTCRMREREREREREEGRERERDPKSNECVCVCINNRVLCVHINRLCVFQNVVS